MRLSMSFCLLALERTYLSYMQITNYIHCNCRESLLFLSYIRASSTVCPTFSPFTNRKTHYFGFHSTSPTAISDRFNLHGQYHPPPAWRRSLCSRREEADPDSSRSGERAERCVNVMIVTVFYTQVSLCLSRWAAGKWSYGIYQQVVPEQQGEAQGARGSLDKD